ncbi:hypothetical protein FDP41_012156 [Naegleria fowleri]|uniref:Pentacotripeptide-repeat region of PRORP domain-containing protein n=1 Tax=Naegleria fowleri TaxID=5763 RepID=A0A6A5C8A2_NAEFO|nr:uncharacterized protein FDP41_012156 [Naegleria fowleri]KAF0981499.1 hypothetical protein FDP41_012156 [Naegleria fowleri]CAG4714303.1 unnamed protein product [Naegleria fowleri]
MKSSSFFLPSTTITTTKLTNARGNLLRDSILANSTGCCSLFSTITTTPITIPFARNLARNLHHSNSPKFFPFLFSHHRDGNSSHPHHSLNSPNQHFYNLQISNHHPSHRFFSTFPSDAQQEMTDLEIIMDEEQEPLEMMLPLSTTEVIPPKKHKPFSKNPPTTSTTFTRNQFTNLLKTLIKSNISEKKFEEYLTLFPAERYDNTINTLIMRFYSTRHNFAMVEAVMKRIKNPDLFVYTQLLNAYSLEGNEQKAEEIFKQISHPDIFVYNSMLTVYARQRNIGKFEGLLQQMKSKAYPNGITYSIILDAYFKVENFDKVDSLFEDIVKKCATGELEPSYIDVQLVNTYLTCLVHSAQYQKALNCFNKYVLGERIEQFLQDMKEKKTLSRGSGPLGVRPNERTILLMLCTFEGMKDEKNFENLITIMRFYKIRPNIYITSKLMQYFFMRKEFKKVIDVYTFSRLGWFKRSYSLVRYISQSYAALDDTEHLLQYITRLEEEGEIQYFNVHSLIYALALVKRPDVAEKLFHKYKSQTSNVSYLLRMYNAMLLCLIRSGLQEKAIQFYKSYPFKPNSITNRILCEKFDRRPENTLTATKKD